jgi:hypothetical protein
MVEILDGLEIVKLLIKAGYKFKIKPGFKYIGEIKEKNKQTKNP